MKQFLTDFRARWSRLAPLWQRAAVWTAAPLTAIALAVAPLPAAAAKHTDPCKVNAASKACKASQTTQKSGKASKAVATKTDKAANKSRSARAEAAKPGAKAGKASKTSAKPAAKLSKKEAANEAAATRAGNRKVTVLSKHHGRVVVEHTARRGETRAERRAEQVAQRRAAQAVAQSSVAQVSAAAHGLDEGKTTTLSANTSPAEAQSLRSRVAYVQDLETSNVLFSKNENVVRPIASISKLMTALVIVDANLPLDQMIEISDDDVDRVRHAPSRLTVGTRLTRADMLHLALMSSENRAAHALGRTYPGGLSAFARAMNSKAQSLGMFNTHFIEPTGLSSENVSSPRDLVRLMRAASQRPLIHRYTTDTEYEVETRSGRTEVFHNTNALVRNADWDIKISKTGFINEAGECLVMLTRIGGRDLAIVLLGSQGKYSRVADAVRLRRFLQNEVAMN
jgi:D-alanyl-D-alanine endopeptidase (penicillin-binding protein 7)